MTLKTKITSTVLATKYKSALRGMESRENWQWQRNGPLLALEPKRNIADVSRQIEMATII